jgi:hypothetical protein
VTSQPLSSRSALAESFFWRSTVLGAAGLGFLATFMLLGQKVATQTGVLLPLIMFLSIYLVLVSLNTLWVARTMAKMGSAARPNMAADAASTRSRRIAATLLSLGFGIVAAVWCVHNVAK